MTPDFGAILRDQGMCDVVRDVIRDAEPRFDPVRWFFAERLEPCRLLVLPRYEREALDRIREEDM